MTTTRDSIQAEIDALRRVEYLVETNDGTFGGAEAFRKVGTGDPAFATRNVYESIGGTRRATGPSEDRAPGYMRSLNRRALAADRKRLADLERECRRVE